MSRNLLMIAFHYPPALGVSGLHRVTGFARHLPAHGWSPLLLTAHPRSYAACGPLLPDPLPVWRAFALDAKRHFALGGHYPRLLALPDRYASWWPGAVWRGLALIRRYRPQAIWSTYPIATAHLIGLTLHRLSGLPWVADFRDPMLFDFYPETRSERWAYRRIEAAALRHCTAAVVVTHAMEHHLRANHPTLREWPCQVIANGIDDDTLAKRPPTPPQPVRGRPLVLLHSGHLYLQEGQRNPLPLLQALAALQRQGLAGPETVQLVLRGCGYEQAVAALVAELGLQSLVRVAPLVESAAALAEMAASDGLLILQGRRFNAQIPAKLYEYLAMRRPILALTDAAGETAALLRTTGGGVVVDPDDPVEIGAALGEFLQACRQGTAPLAPDGALASLTRAASAARLAKLLEVCQKNV